jgi:hypothetical protein
VDSTRDLDRQDALSHTEVQPSDDAQSAWSLGEFYFLPHSGALLVLLLRCHCALAAPSAAPVHLLRPLSIPTNPRSSMRAPAL